MNGFGSRDCFKASNLTTNSFEPRPVMKAHFFFDFFFFTTYFTSFSGIMVYGRKGTTALTQDACAGIPS